MLQGVLFDMDGLMFDTERIGRDGWHKAAEILHIDLPEGIIAAMRGTGTDRCSKNPETAFCSRPVPAGRALTFPAIWCHC